jgi:triacylglycerol lipase
VSAARLPHAEDLAPETRPGAEVTPQLRIEEILASPRRLWLRGRLFGLVPALPENGQGRRWWGRAQEPASTCHAHLECQVSGNRLEADVPVQPDGRFEALLGANLPPARRGWRVARARVTVGGVVLEGCAVVLLPSLKAAGAVAVLLPLATTYSEGGTTLIEHTCRGTATGTLVRRLAQGPSGRRPVYYLAGVPMDADGRHRELALATASLGWPSGHIVPILCSGPTPDALCEGLDRLRWLLAGSLDLLVLNEEPTAAVKLRVALQSTPDRATISGLANPGDDPCGLLSHADAEQTNGSAPRPLLSRAGRVTRFPVVFCHGMLAFSTLRHQLPEDLNSFSSLRPLLHRRDVRALFPQVAPTGGVVARAHELRDQIRRWTNEPVNLVAHSMGGLDARYLISRLGLADQVRSLTTISTPHRGTGLADWFIGNYRHRVPLLLAMELMGTNVDGFADCRPRACAEFNRHTPDAPGVHYFSYGGAVTQSCVSPILRRPWTLLTPVEGPNDGMVSLASAQWGEYLGTIKADHFAQTPDGVFLRPGEDFDALGFYLKVVEDLAYRGF